MLKSYRTLTLRIIKMPVAFPGESPGPYIQIVDAPDHTSLTVPIQLTADAAALRKIALLDTAGDELIAFGRAFFQQLFEPGRVGPLYTRVCTESELNPDVGLRIQVIPQDMGPMAPEQAEGSWLQLPWEYLYDQSHQRFLALDSNRLSLVRSSPEAGACQDFPTRWPLRMLTVLANPRVGARHRIDVEQERRLIESAVAQAGLNAVVGPPDDPRARAPGVDVVITHLDQLDDGQGSTQKASRGALKRYLADRPRPHIIHFCCHGSYEDNTHEGLLILEREPVPGQEQGQQDKLAARELRSWLADLVPEVRLVVLNACSTAPTREVASFKSIAESAVQAGVPAVVAMQFDIPLDVAPLFARGFYTQFFKACLKEKNPIDLALARAREEILSLKPVELPHWGIPVLYRHPSGIEPFCLVSGDLWEQARNLMDQLFFQRQQRDNLKQMSERYAPGSVPGWLTTNLAQAEQAITALEAQLQNIFHSQ